MADFVVDLHTPFMKSDITRVHQAIQRRGTPDMDVDAVIRCHTDEFPDMDSIPHHIMRAILDHLTEVGHIQTTYNLVAPSE